MVEENRAELFIVSLFLHKASFVLFLRTSEQKIKIRKIDVCEYKTLFYLLSYSGIFPSPRHGTVLKLKVANVANSARNSLVIPD